MYNLTELRQRKAALKVQIASQRSELKNTLHDIREAIEPSQLLKSAIAGLFSSKKRNHNNLNADAASQSPSTLAFLADLFIRDRRLAFLVKLLAPLAVRLIPSLRSGAIGDVPVKAKLYGELREQVAQARQTLRKTTPETDTPQDSAPA
jgi:hypothetical protein